VAECLTILDTQIPFWYERCAYSIPELLSELDWINLHLSKFAPHRVLGEELSSGVENQNLEQLTYPDETFDILITSDVMEHVRLDDRAHSEIARVLKPGGVYLFTVPHFRDRVDTFVRVEVSDPEDPSRDRFLTEPEYHADANSLDGYGALSYRSYGTEIDDQLKALGFAVDYSKSDDSEVGRMNTELFYCQKKGV
jgi:SAM-dependent methyltransferase